MREQNTDNPRGDSRASLIISVTALVLGQVFAVGWWAAAINAKLDGATEKISALQATQYTRTEASANFRNVELQVFDLTRRVNSLEDRKVSR